MTAIKHFFIAYIVKWHIICAMESVWLGNSNFKGQSLHSPQEAGSPYLVQRKLAQLDESTVGRYENLSKICIWMLLTSCRTNPSKILQASEKSKHRSRESHPDLLGFSLLITDSPAAVIPLSSLILSLSAFLLKSHSCLAKCSSSLKQMNYFTTH